MIRVLIIEDDPDIALSLRYALEREGEFQVTLTGDGEAGLSEVGRNGADLILLDLNLPGADGMEICRRLRRLDRTATIPLVMLTARIEEAQMLSGLEIGADDYITKPFSIREVLARIRALLRRTQGSRPEPELVTGGGIELNRGERRVTADGREVSLTRMEFDLLADLMSRPGYVASREQLLERVWDYERPGSTRTVDVHIRQLRKKLGRAAAERIETVVGVGYRFRRDG